MHRILLLAIIVSVSILALAGCGEKPAGDTAADAAGGAVETPETAELSETIVLATGWEMNDAVTPAEVEVIMGRTGFQTWAEPLSDAAAGKPQGSFYDGQLAASCVNFLVYCTEGQSNYDRVLGYVENPVTVENDLWDGAVVGEMIDMADTLAAILLQKGDVCIRIRYDIAIYPELDRTGTLTRLAGMLVNNLYGVD